MWEGAQIFHAFSGHTTFPASLDIQQPGNSLNLFIWGFVKALLHRHGEINLWPLVTCWEPLWEIPPMTRSWGKDLTRKAIQDTRDLPGWPRPLPHPVSSPPPTFLLLFLFALLQILVLPAESSSAPPSLNKDQLKTLINKSPRCWYPMKRPGMKEMLQFKPFCWHSGLFDKCVLPLQEVSWWLLAGS